jgi:hypothetical protein
MPILLIIIAPHASFFVGFALWLWAGVLIAGGGQTILGIAYSLSTAGTLPGPLSADGRRILFDTPPVIVRKAILCLLHRGDRLYEGGSRR